MKNNLFIILTILIVSNGFGQVHPDSLKGIYDGEYSVLYTSSPTWVSTPDSEYVTFIDTINCLVDCSGDIGVFNAAHLETYYSYCYGNSPDGFIRFYSGDSLFIKFTYSFPPPPDYNISQVKFIGKRIPGSSNVGINENIIKFNLTVYPNPTNDVLNFYLNSVEQNAVYSIHNLNGKLLKKDNIKLNTNSPLTINIKELPKGLYLLSIFNNKKTYNTKFIKE